MSQEEEDRQAQEQWIRQEEEIGHEEMPERLISVHEEDLHPSRSWIHRIFIFGSVVTGLTAAGMIFGQILGCIYQKDSPIQYALRFYVMLFSFIAILNELEWTTFIRDSKLTQNWITRGLFYVFLGLMGLAQNELRVSPDQENQRYTIIVGFVDCVAWMMFACGALYMIMGVCCLNVALRRLRTGFQERKDRARILLEQDGHNQRIHG